MLQSIDKGFEWESSPRNNHGPRLNAAHPINPIFRCDTLDQIIEVVSRGHLAHAFNLDRPRLWFEILGVSSGIVFVSAEFVIVVVTGDLFECVRLLCRVVSAFGLRFTGSANTWCTSGNDRTGSGNSEHC